MHNISSDGKTNFPQALVQKKWDEIISSKSSNHFFLLVKFELDFFFFLFLTRLLLIPPTLTSKNCSIQFFISLLVNFESTWKVYWFCCNKRIDFSVINWFFNLSVISSSLCPFHYNSFSSSPPVTPV